LNQQLDEGSNMTKIIIDANKRRFVPNLRELYRYKDLFLTLSWRDFKVRYAQTTIGLLWAILQPVVTLFILSLVFGKFVGVETKVPHLLFTIAGMSIWTYFSYVMTYSGGSIIASSEMVKKIYFPRLIIPLSKALVGFIDFGIALLILITLMVYYHVIPSANIWAAPLFMLMGVVAAIGVGIWLSALSVRFRDFQHVVPFLVQIGMYITPIAYPAEFATEKLPEWAANVYYLNPMAGVVQGFRWSLFGGEAPGALMWVSLGTIIFIFISGLFYFSKVEKSMADYV
jgi:lipopolysaccharide transport system permease protein